MLRKMDLTTANTVSEIEDFITTFSQSNSLGAVKYCEIWSGDRSYWFAYMLQLAFDSGSIVRDRDTNNYYWQDRSGNLYGPTGQVRGIIVLAGSGSPYNYQLHNLSAFMKEFFTQNGKEIPLMRSLFGQQYPWYFAHIIQHAVNLGEVIFKVDEDRELHPVWWDGSKTCCDVCGTSLFNPADYIKEDEFASCIQYFRSINAMNPALKDEVERIVERHLAKRRTNEQSHISHSMASDGAETFITELHKVKGFISRFMQDSGLNAATYREVWSGDRGYWFAYILQLTFNSGTILQAMDTEDYFWMDHNGNIFCPTGMVRGLVLRNIKGAPISYLNNNPGTFVDTFFKEYVEEVPNMRAMFERDYPWHFANMIHHATGFGKVCFKMTGDGVPYPVCCDHTGRCYSATGLSTISSAECIEEDEFVLCLDYFRKVPGTDKNLHEEVMKIVAQHKSFESAEQAAKVNEVLAFISHFTGTDGEQVGALRKVFALDYSLYFATMLQTAFQRGSVQMLYPYIRFVWVDTDGTAYDIAGVSDISGASLLSWESLESIHHKLLHPELR